MPAVPATDPRALLVDRFDDAVRAHMPTLRRLAAVTATGVDPDDVVQEALLRAWHKRTSYDPDRGSVRTWLLAITADRARRLRQRNPTRTWVELDLIADGDADAHPTLPDVDLRRAVNRLSTRQRQAVLLYYYVDLSTEDTAALMRCATGTVKSTLADARARLAIDLGESEEAPDE